MYLFRLSQSCTGCTQTLRAIVFRNQHATYQHGKNMIKRHFSEKKYSDIKKILEDKSRHERNYNLTEDVLLFSNKGQNRKYTMIKCSGYIMAVMFVNMADFVNHHWIKSADDDSKNWYDKLGRKAQIAIILIVLLAAILVPLGCSLYVGKTVKTITLIKGGKSVQIETYRAFGKSNIREVELNHISAAYGLDQTVTDFLIRVKGDKLGYMLDFRDGIIHNKQMLSDTLGIRRKL